MCFTTLEDNGARGRYLISRLFLTDRRIAPSSRRCTWNIPDISSSNFSFFLWVVSQGSRRSPASRPSITETSARSRPCRRFVFTLPAGSGAPRWKNECITSCLSDSPSNRVTCAIILPTGHLQHRPSGRPCWPVSIKRGWWRYDGI